MNDLQTNQKNGLGVAEVQARKEKYGENKLREKKKKTTLQRFIEQFKDAMILILIAAAIVSFVVVCLEKNWEELFEPALILIIVIVNAIMGVYQEGKAEKALDALKNMSAPHARVIREGKESIVEAAELVPGDIIRLEAVEDDVMDHKPKPKNEGIFAHGLGIRVILQGLMFAILTLVGFKLGEKMGESLEAAQTMAFIVLALSQTVQAFNMRSDHSLFKIGLFTNSKLSWAVLVSVVLVLAVLFTPLRVAFCLVLLPAKLYLIALGLVLVPMVVMELSKALGLIKPQK